MHYGPVVALHKATFNVERGEVVGLLGPNGAGKSTTMKLLTTYLYPTFGHATVGGRQLAQDKTVLLSTHILQEVEAVADRLVIINAGCIVGDGTLPYQRFLAPFLRPLSMRTWKISFSVSGLTVDTGTMTTAMVSPTALNISRA